MVGGLRLADKVVKPSHFFGSMCHKIPPFVSSSEIVRLSRKEYEGTGILLSISVFTVFGGSHAIVFFKGFAKVINAFKSDFF